MIANPLKVSCPGCGANFHIPTHLVRGKVVNFRCKKCRGTIPVDGRALTAATPAPFPNPNASPTGQPGDGMPEPRGPVLSIIEGIGLHDGLPSTTGLQLDTPATFSHSSAPPPRGADSFAVATRTPALGVSARASTPPPGLSRTDPGDRRHSNPPPSVRSSGRNKKVIGGAAILAAAGLTLWSVGVRRSSHLPAPAPTGATHAGTSARTQTNEVRPAAESPRPAPNPASTGAAKQTLPVASPMVAKTAEPSPAKASARAKARGAKPAVDPNDATQPLAVPAAEAPADVQAASGSTPAQEVTGASTQDIEFNKDAARQALEEVSPRAAVCRTIDTPAGAARIAVTFAPSGTVTSAIVESGPFVGTPAGGCVASKFRSVRVPVFTGDPVTVHKSVPF